jgi:adenylate kinase
MNLVILGPQGSGKGTQAEKLARKFNLEHIDMGKFLREVAKQDTPLGREVYNIQNVSRTLVPSRILEEVLSMKINSLPREQGVLFEGVPRNVDQAEYFEKAMLESGRHIDKVIVINISKEESFRRISKRWVCKKCRKVLIMGEDIGKPEDKCPDCGGEVIQRKDDVREGIETRLKIFEEETKPVIEYFDKKRLAININGEQAQEEVFGEILSKLKEITQ